MNLAFLLFNLLYYRGGVCKSPCLCANNLSCSRLASIQPIPNPLCLIQDHSTHGVVYDSLKIFLLLNDVNSAPASRRVGFGADACKHSNLCDWGASDIRNFKCRSFYYQGRVAQRGVGKAIICRLQVMLQRYSAGYYSGLKASSCMLRMR